jgi:hypothetical protein
VGIMYPGAQQVSSLNFNRLLPLVPDVLMNVSGEVFYSGRAAFEVPSPLYLLGLNPGSDGADRTLNTVKQSLEQTASSHPERFSRYVDEFWNRASCGYTPMQRRMQHFASRVGIDLRGVPASNLVFKRSIGVDQLKSDLDELADLCWPLHSEVIRSQEVKVVVCLGGDVFDYVSRRVGAHQYHSHYSETNSRGWQSIAVRNREGLFVVKLTHPGRANWISREADPSRLVKNILDETTHS